MCNPYIVAGASAVLQYQVANAQQKSAQQQAQRQNELALKIEMLKLQLHKDS